MLLAVVLGVLALSYAISWRADPARTLRAARRSAAHLGGVASQLVAVLLGMGLLAELLPHAPSAEVLQRVHGAAGIVLAGLVGAVSSGGPVISYPLAGALFQHGAGLPAGATAALLTAWTSVSGVGLPLEAATLGKGFALARNAVALLFACLVGFAVACVYARA